MAEHVDQASGEWDEDGFHLRIETDDGRQASWIPWAAGFFEGEGSITTRSGKPVIQLGNNDEAAIRTFALVLGGTVLGPYDKPYSDGFSRQPHYKWVPNTEQSLIALRKMWPWLSARRKERALEVGFHVKTIDHGEGEHDFRVTDTATARELLRAVAPLQEWVATEERERAAYNRASPEERRAVIEGRGLDSDGHELLAEHVDLARKAALENQ